MKNMKKPVLVVMAAGMGSRYGGLKQIDPIDKEGHIIMDFSIYDAVRAGFEKVVFIIKKENESDFKAAIGDRISRIVEVAYVFQDLYNLPEGYEVPEGRVKPWGTGHAVLMAKDIINEPFAVINADDFYGKDSFKVLCDALNEMNGKENEYCMVAFQVGNTLSESGTVSRGVCRKGEDGCLETVTERHGIMRRGATVSYLLDDVEYEIADDTLVSMNMWGFTPDYFAHSEKAFVEFLTAHGKEQKSEFYIPSVVNDLITSGQSKVKVYMTPSLWFGVTYAEDKPSVKAQIAALVEKGEYPEKLF